MAFMDLFRNQAQEVEMPSSEGGLPVNKDTISYANGILMRYKAGLSTRDNRLLNNEEWYRGRNDSNKEVNPTSAWLFHSITSKHADMMDNIPQANILPRESSDETEAKTLSSILPCILKQNEFPLTYSQVALDKLKSGTGIYCVTWDASKLNGLGDISLTCIDPINIYTEPGVEDIQDSPNLFLLTLANDADLKAQYPGVADHLGVVTEIKQYYGINYDMTDKSVVVDWYYKKMVNGRMVLHFAKFVNDMVLESTENLNPEVGLYDHNLYPFVTDRLFPIKATAYGFGFIDYGKNPQEYIDKLDTAILENMYANASPRWFIRNDGSVNETEYKNIQNKFIHVQGANLGDDSIRPVTVNPLPSQVMNVLQYKVEELKETTGNRDVMNGGTQSGVTAASAVAALQESGGKLVRDITRVSYHAFEQVVTLCIELIRQFYDLPRQFRIVAENGVAEYVTYSNANLKPQPQGIIGGVDMGYRVPTFDLDVVAQKSTMYTKMANNELALQMYQLGFFNPMNAGSAIACLQMMDFDQKDKVLGIVQSNLMNYGMMAMDMGGGNAAVSSTNTGENPIVERARERANSTAEVQ